MPLTVENAWNFYFPLRSGCIHMFFRKEKQNFYIISAGISSSKSTIEALEQGIKYVQSQNWPLGNITGVILFYTLSYCFDCWLWAHNASKNCENFLYWCQIKVIEQLKR